MTRPYTLPSNVVPNFPAGGNGGRNFQEYHNDASQLVRKIEFWVAFSSEWNSRFLGGLRITWTDTTSSPVYGTETAHKREFTFEPGERITTMTLWAYSRTDRIMWTTDRGRTFGVSPNTSTTPFKMEVGSGLLAGFEGAAANDIDRLCPLFLKLTGQHANKLENFGIGGEGGTSFWTCGADSSHLVWKVEFWVESSPLQNNRYLRGMRIIWTDGTESRVYGTTAGELTEFTFQPGEKILTMTLWGCVRTDRITWTTDMGRTFEASPNLSTESFNMEVGSGLLAGFEGASGVDIDRLAPIFLKS
jgi:hypothetical protein